MTPSRSTAQLNTWTAYTVYTACTAYTALIAGKTYTAATVPSYIAIWLERFKIIAFSELWKL